MRKIEIKHVKQPTPVSCVHACLAMVTGEDVTALVERFGNHGLCWEEEATVLVEHKIFPVPVAAEPHKFPLFGVYLATVPSLNRPGDLHRVVIECSEDRDSPYQLHDPNTGRQGVEVYPWDGIQTGKAKVSDIVYLDTFALRKMHPVTPQGLPEALS